MKRFLSLFLSALVTLQAVNIRCDAASHYRNTAPNYNSAGGAYHGQPVMIMQSPPYIPQQQPIINVTAPEPTPQHITIQQPEIKQDFKMKVDATTTADKLWSWLKIALVLALGYVVLNASWPIIKIFTGISNPVETVKGWGKNAVKWVKGIWNEGGEDTLSSYGDENGSSSESWWGANLWQKWIIPIITLGTMSGSSFGKM